MFRARITVIVTLAASISWAAGSELRAQERGITEALVTADPLDWAAWVHSNDDELILQGLTASDDTLSQGTAVLCSEWLSAPEEALPHLIPIAVGRDPDLAPMATSALWNIAKGWSLRDPNPERPGISGELLVELSAAASDETLRPDIRQALALSHALLVGPGESEED